MIEQNQTNTGKTPPNQQHLMGDIDGEDVKDVVKKGEKISARRKIEELLESKRLKALTQDFDFDDL